MKKPICLLASIFLMTYFVIEKGTVRLENIRYYSYSDYTRVVLDLSSSIKITEKILPGDRITRLYFDLEKCSFGRQYPDNKKREINVESGNLQRIRIGKRNKYTVRIVFDFDRIGKYEQFYLTSPFRIVFDIFQENFEKTIQTKNLNKPPTNEDGDFSIVRQLGLGVQKIVIDPGHGGKDPGATNKKLSLYEKNITLDIAKRMKVIFKKYRNYEIILTRDSDKYISLEERTAIANSKNGDLFISIHLNSAPRKNVRGIETYYLSMTGDPWAISVAAQENAMSTKSIGQMKSIIEGILKNAKISESKILSKYLQKGIVNQLSKKYKTINNLGVKKAPFYVLVGAKMPSSLVEVSFLSNYREAKNLSSSLYKQQIASGLVEGIISYIKSLGKNETFL